MRAKSRGHTLIQVKILGSDPAAAATWISEALELLEPTDTFIVDANTSEATCVCVCVCVCVRERERERECSCVCVSVCA